LFGGRLTHRLLVVDDRRLHAVHRAQSDRRRHLPRLHLLSRAEGVSVPDPDAAHRPLSHTDGYALVCARRPHPRDCRLPRRHHHVGDEARPRREGHRRTDPRPWRHSRPRRQPDLRGAGIRAFRPLFLLPMSKNPLTRLLRFLFFAVVVRAVILVALGLTVRNRERLPKDGPGVLAGNHNSNLDALAMMSLMPLRLLSKLRPVAAMDYFYSSKLRGWFADNIVGIIPVKRGSGKEGGNPLLLAEQALDRGEILVIFPEGTRGEPETLQAFKKGIGHLAKARPNVPVLPVFMHGLGKALPRGSALLVPFNVIVSFGDPLYGKESYHAFVSEIEAAMTALAAQEKLPVWE